VFIVFFLEQKKPKSYIKESKEKFIYINNDDYNVIDNNQLHVEIIQKALKIFKIKENEEKGINDFFNQIIIFKGIKNMKL
jgi:hypothetical protein